MSEAKQDEVYGRLSRELRDVSTHVASLEVELKRIGKAFEQTGKDLQNLMRLDLDKAAVEQDIANLWKSLSEYRAALLEKADKELQLSKLN